MICRDTSWCSPECHFSTMMSDKRVVLVDTGVSLAPPASTSMESLVLTRLMAALSGLPGPTCHALIVLIGIQHHPDVALLHTVSLWDWQLPPKLQTTSPFFTYLDLLQIFLIFPDLSCHNLCWHGAAGFISFGCTLAMTKLGKSWRCKRRPCKVAAQLHSFEETASFTKKQTINVDLRAMTFPWPSKKKLVILIIHDNPRWSCPETWQHSKLWQIMAHY